MKGVILEKQELKEIIDACLQRVYNHDGMIESATAEAMSAIDEFAGDDEFDYLGSDVSLTKSMVAGGIPEGFLDYRG